MVSQHKAFVYLCDWLSLKEVTVLEPKPGVEPTASHLQSVLSSRKATPSGMVLYAAHQDSRSSEWLGKNAGIAAVKILTRIADCSIQSQQNQRPRSKAPPPQSLPGATEECCSKNGGAGMALPHPCIDSLSKS